jgi:hypothetical protein
MTDSTGIWKRDKPMKEIQRAQTQIKTTSILQSPAGRFTLRMINIGVSPSLQNSTAGRFRKIYDIYEVSQ